MFKIIYPSADATLYEALPSYNTGIDEILEVGKRLSTAGESYLNSRFVIQFDMNDIKSALSKYSVDLDTCKFMLQLYTTNAKNLPAQYTIDANIVTDSWNNGTGFQNSNPAVTDGVCWNTPKSGSGWTSGSQNYNIPGTDLYASGSGKGGSWLYQVSDGFYSSSFYSQSFYTQPGIGTGISESFSTRPTDINMDVTGAVKTWISGSGGVTVPNNGFILKFSETDENDINQTGFIRFFSRETHTIYVPRILMLFDKSTFNNGTLTEFDIDSYKIYTSLQKEYKDTSVNKIRIYARDKYPQKSPTNLFPQQTVKYLPEGTLYSVIDAATDEIVVPYDSQYTKISCDSTSNFINIDMTGLMPERYYRLAFKVVSGFYEDFIEDDLYFKVVR